MFERRTVLAVGVLLAHNGDQDVAVAAHYQRPRRHVEDERRLVLAYEAYAAAHRQDNAGQEHDDGEDEIDFGPEE